MSLNYVDWALLTCKKKGLNKQLGNILLTSSDFGALPHFEMGQITSEINWSFVRVWSVRWVSREMVWKSTQYITFPTLHFKHRAALSLTRLGFRNKSLAEQQTTNTSLASFSNSSHFWSLCRNVSETLIKGCVQNNRQIFNTFKTFGSFYCKWSKIWMRQRILRNPLHTAHLHHLSHGNLIF